MRSSGIAVAGGIVATLGLTACGGGSSGGSEPATFDAGGGTAVAAECKAAPVKGGSLVYSRQAETQSLNPIDLRNGNGDIFASELLYNGLTRADPEGGDELLPGLAESWEVSNGGKTYTFKLRQGVKFSNGDPLTAEDVKFSLDRFGDPKINQILSVVAVGYDKATVVDDSTVRVDLTEPVAAFLYNISIFPAFIVPKKLVEEQGDAFWKTPVGTGPYRLKTFVRGSYIAFERNPNYWEDGKPYLDEVRFNFASDSNSRLLALKNDQAQIADGVPFSQITPLKADKNIVLQQTKVPQFVGLWLNHKRAPLADLNVRKAMQYALDRNQIKNGVFKGAGSVPNSVLPPLKYDAGADQVPPYPFDLAKAKAEMAKSKHAQGFSTTLQYPAGYDYYKQLGLLLQNQWAQIGIKVKLIEEDGATGTDRFNSGDYDMTIPYAQFTSDLTVPDEYAGFLADPASGTNGFFSNWSDPAITKLVKTFATTPDEAERAKQWPVIQKAMLDQTPVINVINLPSITAHRTNVCGTDINALGADRLENTWLTTAKAGR
jgi:peptide/nickel transport system substrate-binding protein